MTITTGLWKKEGKKRKLPHVLQPVQSLASTSESKQTIMAAFIDSKGTLIRFFPSGHDGFLHDNCSYKSASDIPSHLFKPFFDRLNQEINFANMEKD